VYADFVAQFRAGVEESMALVEQEVALLDALERAIDSGQESGADSSAAARPIAFDALTDHQLASMQGLLQDRILTASSLQMALHKALRHHWQRHPR